MYKSVYLFLFFVLIHTSFAQNIITVYRVDTKGYNQRIFDIEDLILDKIVSLHQRKTGQQITFKIHSVNEFRDLLPTLLATKNPYSMAMSGLSITKERQEYFDFSSPYIFVSSCIIRLTHSKSEPDKWKKKHTPIGYTPGTTADKLIYKLKDIYSIRPKSYVDLAGRIRGLKNGDVEFVIAETIDSWAIPEIEVVQLLNEDQNNGYGIAYKKESSLKELFNPYIHYIIRSPDFRKLMLDTFGKEYIHYYKKHL